MNFPGPYPSKPVYDYNTFDLVRLIRKMNAGLDHNEKEFGGRTDFAVSCTAMPVAKRMEKKITAGADFFQTQVVYDADNTIEFLKAARPLASRCRCASCP